MTAVGAPIDLHQTGAQTARLRAFPDRPMNSPAQSASVFGNDNIIVQASGSGVNVTVQSGRPYLRLTQYREAHETRGRATIPKPRCSAPTARTSSRSSAATARSKSCERWLDDPREFPSAFWSARADAARRGSRWSLRGLLLKADGLPVSLARRSSTAFAARTALSNGAGTSPSSSSSITPPAAPSKSAIGSANLSTRRSRTGPSCGYCCWNGRPNRVDRLARDNFRPRRQRQFPRRDRRCSIRRNRSNFRRSTNWNSDAKSSRRLLKRANAALEAPRARRRPRIRPPLG